MESAGFPMNVHPMFWAPIWRKVLSCFSDKAALILCTTFGGLELGWYVRERLQIGLHWGEAVSASSPELMLYLLRWGIPCENYARCAQQAVNKRRLSALIFLLSDLYRGPPWIRFREEPPVHDGASSPLPRVSVEKGSRLPFLDMNGRPVTHTPVPELDGAVVSNSFTIVSYTLWRFRHVPGVRLLRMPSEVLSVLIEKNRSAMFCLLVPQAAKVSSWKSLEDACQYGYETIVRHAVLHMDMGVPQEDLKIPDLLLKKTAEGGHLELFRFLYAHPGRRRAPVPVEVFRTAFRHGHARLCVYIRTLQPSFRPSKKDLVLACENNQDSVFDPQHHLLHPRQHIPNKCFERAVRGSKPGLFKRLYQLRPDYVFMPKLLVNASESGCTGMTLLVYHVGKYTQAPPIVFENLARNNMVKEMEMFQRIGLRPFNVNTLLAAAGNGAFDVVRSTFETGKLRLDPEAFRTVYNKLYVCTVDPADHIRRLNTLQYLQSKMQEQSAPSSSSSSSPPYALKQETGL